MAIKATFLTGGTNALQSTSDSFNKIVSWYFSTGVPPAGSVGATGAQSTGDFAVQAKLNKVVTVKAGKYIVSVTPTGETTRNVMVELDADYDVTIADNVTGATRYDKIYIYLPAATLIAPPANGDFTEAIAIKTQRDATVGASITDINYATLAEITVANGFTSITDANISDKRAYSTIDGKSVKDATITTAKLDAEKKKGWDALPALTYQSATTASGAGLLSYLEVGDKVKLNQSIPLTAYFPFEDKDSDVGSFTVSNVGTPTYSAGKFANALTLNGSDQALAITDDTLFKPTGAFTIGCWIDPTASAATKMIFQSYATNNGVRLYIEANTGKVVFETGATTVTAITGTTDITSGGMHYVVVEFLNNIGKIFVDGALQTTGYMITPAYAVTNYVRIGCGNSSGANNAWFVSQIDDLFFINGHAVDKYWVAAKYAEATAQGTGNITATYKGYVQSVTDTLITFDANSDYALYNGAITYPYYSHGNAVGFPSVFNYAPNAYANDGTTVIARTLSLSRFWRDGIFKNFEISMYPIANPGGTKIYIDLPIPATSIAQTRYIGSAYAGTNNTNANGYLMIPASVTAKAAAYLNAEVTWSASGNESIMGTFIYL